MSSSNGSTKDNEGIARNTEAAVANQDAAHNDEAKIDRPYQVVIYVGPRVPEVADAKVVDLTPTGDVIAEGRLAVVEVPASESPADGLEAPVPAEPVFSHPVLDKLRDSGLLPADLRARAVFRVDADTDPAAAVTAYAAMVGFAGRRIDASCGDSRVDAATLDSRTRGIATAAGPVSAGSEHVQVGATHSVLPSAGATGSLNPEEVGLVRGARRLRLVPPPDALGAVAQFVVVSALRARGESDRFPFLVRGDEPAPEEGAEVETVGLDLDAVRRSAVDLRRSLRSEDRSSLAPKQPLSSRQRTLLAAAAMPVEATMEVLGSSTPDGELWHCPRPDRHTNGDANASMRVSKGKARCFRCDPERVDSLRLVMDVKTVTADDAADWLLANVTPPAPPEATDEPVVGPQPDGLETVDLGLQQAA